uniref:Uncharacterized protein n=1 Tax=Leptobrachium leishanense TaxID=445787 RepID=A0A8C5LN53_9ANUR
MRRLETMRLFLCGAQQLGVELSHQARDVSADNRGETRLEIVTPGGSTPPGITAPAVPSIPSPIGVNGYTGLPPQANGQPSAEAVFANGIHPYPAQSPTAADPLQQAYAGVQQYAGS